jgi:hypothetical protein
VITPYTPAATPKASMGRDELARWESAARRACRTNSEHRVLSAVAGTARRYPVASPSVEGIAARAGVGVRTVIRATRALERAGVWRIWRDRPYRQADGTWRRARTNAYLPSWSFRHKPPGGTDMPPMAPLCDSEAIRTGRLWTTRRRRRPAGREKPPALALTWCLPDCPRCSGVGFVETAPRTSAPCPGRVPPSAAGREEWGPT